MYMFIGGGGDKESPNFQMILDVFKIHVDVPYLMLTYFASSF